MEKLSRAIIVAAGEGTRLRPVTLKTPKPLVRVNGTRLIDTSVNALKNNGIHEIYIVCGYKIEKFREAFADDPEIHIIENPWFEQGNNITSLYAARQYLPGAFVLEGDLLIRNEAVMVSETEKSGYCASWVDETDEWTLQTEGERILSCCPTGGRSTWRLWGISMWTGKDGELLKELIREQFEDRHNWSIYWDEIAMLTQPEKFDLYIRKVSDGDIVEIDTLEELAQIDPSYKDLLDLKAKQQ